MSKIKSFFQDFKKFISRGNILDMAVGVVIGGAFSKIVTALVNNIIMPLVTSAIPGGLEGFVTVLNPKQAEVTEKTINTISYWGHTYDADIVNVMNWGVVINSIIEFLIIAFILFCILRAAMKFSQLSSEEKVAKTALTKEEIKELKSQGKSRSEIKQIALKKVADQKAKDEEAKKLAEENKETELKVLKEIKELLEKR